MPLDLALVLAEELSLEPRQVRDTLALFAEGGTVPFLARYRKEQTGGLDEVVLRRLDERHRYLSELEERKAAVLASIDEQGRLTDDLRARIDAVTQKAELEDLYLPYRPKRRTRATVARERGLEPLADWIRARNRPDAHDVPLREEAARYVDPERDVASADDALQGASDILAEGIAEQAEHRAHLRAYLLEHGIFSSRIKEGHAEGTTKYEMYRDYRVPVKEIAAHNMLALRRGEAEGVLLLNLDFDEAYAHDYLSAREIHAGDPALRAFLRTTVEDAFERLMKTALTGEIRLRKKEEADAASIETFAANLRELLLASPAGMRPTLGVDPGFRTGCKVAVLDHTGRFLEYAPVFPHGSAARRASAAETLQRLIRQHDIELIAIGNGTASRETDVFVGEVLDGLEEPPIKVLVSEAGASVYSASEVAIEEFPDQDVTVRGAISIGRRLQDPLAELVKIDPKSIGVGQYQHDVDQGELKRKLEETVESCVNFVGVNLNTASAALLRFVAGVTPAVAKHIVAHRDAHGPFQRREDLLEVTRFGPKTFEQAAGFLRIRDGDRPLDNTGVHPESYPVVETMARDLGVALDEITQVPDRLRRLDLRRYVSEHTGLPTLRDIVAELEKPGRDPREQFRYATFREDVQTLQDLRVGMWLEGVVTNVANFGAFVDVGVHRDGLVHVSQLADRYVRDPQEVVKVGQVVRVRVIKVDEKLGRISLSMRAEETGDTSDAKQKKPKKRSKTSSRPDPKARSKPAPEKPSPSSSKPNHTIEDLQRKFNRPGRP